MHILICISELTVINENITCLFIYGDIYSDSLFIFGNGFLFSVLSYFSDFVPMCCFEVLHIVGLYH